MSGSYLIKFVRTRSSRSGMRTPALSAASKDFIIHAMYSGLVAYVNSETLPFLQPLVLALSLLPGLLSCFLGYYIGASDKTLRGILGFKVKVNKE